MTDKPALSQQPKRRRQPYPKDAVSKIIEEALRGQRRSRRTKYEIALDALLRVQSDFEGADAVAIEDALTVLRGRTDADA